MSDEMIMNESKNQDFGNTVIDKKPNVTCIYTLLTLCDNDDKANRT